MLFLLLFIRICKLCRLRSMASSMSLMSSEKLLLDELLCFCNLFVMTSGYVFLKIGSSLNNVRGNIFSATGPFVDRDEQDIIEFVERADAYVRYWQQKFRHTHCLFQCVYHAKTARRSARRQGCLCAHGPATQELDDSARRAVPGLHSNFVYVRDLHITSVHITLVTIFQNSINFQLFAFFY